MPRGWRLYVRNLLVSGDQFVNTLFGGSPDETVSSRAGKSRGLKRAWATALCRALEWVDPGHCTDAIEWDEGDDRVINYQKPKDP